MVLWNTITANSQEWLAAIQEVLLQRTQTPIAVLDAK